MPPNEKLLQFDALPGSAFVRLDVVRAVTGLSEWSLQRLAARGKFPTAIPLTGTKARGYRVSQIRSWLAEPASYSGDPRHPTETPA